MLFSAAGISLWQLDGDTLIEGEIGTAELVFVAILKNPIESKLA